MSGLLWFRRPQETRCDLCLGTGPLRELYRTGVEGTLLTVCETCLGQLRAAILVEGGLTADECVAYIRDSERESAARTMTAVVVTGIAP